jgi:hypothetical protein
MTCEHCLRGDAQNMDMTKEIVDAALKGVTSIYQVTFSGGEPTLNLPIIKYVTKVIKAKKINLSAFWVVTNGKQPSMAIVTAMLDLYNLCDEPEFCGLSWSNDPYHVGVQEPKLYKGLSFFSARLTPDSVKKYDMKNLIAEGRALENSLTEHTHSKESISFEEYDGELQMQSTVYIAANGNVMPDCDCSFDRIDEEAIGNVLTGDLEAILRAAKEGV